jgi:uncharacterized membrane protein
MPYCHQCGNNVDEADIYCGKCGTRQPVEPGALPPRPASDPFAGMTPRTASILCYIPVVGWIAAIVVLAAEKFRTNRAVRFHAFQGLYLFVLWLIVCEVIGPMFRPLGDYLRVDKVLDAGVLFLWIFMIIKTSQGQTYSLPVIGELADRSLAER